ncbi:MAG: hypothetical protein ACOYXC_12450 [Candidatus Rifleibacteriota bacterium]
MSQIQNPELNQQLPISVAQFISQIFRGFFTSFLKNLFKALIGTFIAIGLPDFFKFIENQNILSANQMYFLKEFAISPNNMLKGCILSSLAVLTGFSLMEKFWRTGILKSWWLTLKGLFSWLNIFRNTATSSFAFGMTSGAVSCAMLNNPLITLTLFISAHLASIVPQHSGLVYFLRFFWQNFYKTGILNNQLIPAHEFVRGFSAGLAIESLLIFSSDHGNSNTIFTAVIVFMVIIGMIRQKRGNSNEI